jgi:hypothetical protein
MLQQQWLGGLLLPAWLPACTWLTTVLMLLLQAS